MSDLNPTLEIKNWMKWMKWIWTHLFFYLFFPCQYHKMSSSSSSSSSSFSCSVYYNNYSVFFFQTGEGTSTNPCSLIYPGEFPEQEPVVKAFAEVLRFVQPRLKSYWTLHSFSQFLLSANSYTETKPSDFILFVSLFWFLVSVWLF